MKKSIFFITVITILSFSTSVESQTRLGIFSGLNHSTFDGQHETGFSFVEYINRGAGFTIGGLLELEFMKNIGIQIETMYEYHRVRAQLTTDIGGFNETINMNLGRLTFPTFVKLGFGNEIRPYLMVGPYLSLNLHSKAHSTIEIGMTAERQLKQSLDSGLAFGLGMSVPISKFVLFLDGLYFHSLKSSINDFIFFDEDIKSRRKLVRIGIRMSR